MEDSSQGRFSKSIRPGFCSTELHPRHEAEHRESQGQGSCLFPENEHSQEGCKWGLEVVHHRETGNGHLSRPFIPKIESKSRCADTEVQENPGGFEADLV